MKIDVVLQGPNDEAATEQVIALFQQQSWVQNIIISTWEGQHISVPNLDSNIKFIFNKDVENPGVGNRNRQIVSSLAGLKEVQTEVAIKTRTDQIIWDLAMMNEFYQKKHTGIQIFTCGMYRLFPFHPRDHFFMGKTQDLLNLFDVPLDPYVGPADYTKILRAEAWLGAHYYAKFSKSVEYMLAYPQEYLVDYAPKLDEALNLDFELRWRLFAVFPRIKLSWPKHGLDSYHYHVGEAYTEYWHEGEW